MSLEELQTPYPRDSRLPIYTAEYLQENHNAKSWLRYLACRGVVFDVTSKEHYAAPGGGYQYLTGTDASLILSKMSKDDMSQMHWRTDLGVDELKGLNDWYKFYEDKYPKVGYLWDPWIDGGQKMESN